MAKTLQAVEDKIQVIKEKHEDFTKTLDMSFKKLDPSVTLLRKPQKINLHTTHTGYRMLLTLPMPTFMFFTDSPTYHTLIKTHLRGEKNDFELHFTYDIDYLQPFERNSYTITSHEMEHLNISKNLQKEMNDRLTSGYSNEWDFDLSTGCGRPEIPKYIQNLITQAKATKIFDTVGILSEVEWKSTPQQADPFVLGIYRDNIYILHEFDLSKLEYYISKEF